MIDALLKEHAQLGSGDDEQFLQSVEARLDADDKVVSMAEGKNQGAGKVGNRFGMGLGIAAGLTVAAVGFYGWHQQREEERTTIVSYHAENPVEREQGKEVISESIPQSEDDGDKGGKADKRVDDALVAEEKRGRIAKPKVAKLEMTRAAERKPSAPSSSMGRAIAANSSSGVAISAPDVRASSLDHGDSDGFGEGWKDDGHSGMRSPRERLKQHVGNRYGALVDNTFKSPWQDPLSTFSVDVDTASYTNVRRMIQHGQSVPADAVRIEEMINYFNYHYPQPEGKHPFSVNVETASCPWNGEHRLVKVGLQGKDVAKAERPAANLVLAVALAAVFHGLSALPVTAQSWFGSRVIGPLLMMAEAGVLVNLGLGLFNLVPIPPLDGSRVLAGLLPVAGARLLAAGERYGFLLLLLLVFSGALRWTVYPPLRAAARLLLG